MAMLRVLMITKPLNPPWTDAAKNHARDIILACPQVRFHYLSAIGGEEIAVRHAKADPQYSLPEPLPLWNKGKVFLRLLKPDEMHLYHFFFTPNPATSGMGRLALAMKPHQPSAQTVCSRPLDHPRLKRLLFADRVVCVSDDTKDMLTAAGVSDVTVIRPAVADGVPPTQAEIMGLRERFGLPKDHTLALFAGDLEFGDAADTLVRALPALLDREDLHIVFCNRMKTPRAKQRQQSIRETLCRLKADSRVSIIPPQADLHPLLKAVDFQMLMPDTLYGKMDIPLVVLEGLSYGKPAILSTLAPLKEIFDEGQAGHFVAPSDADALTEAVFSLCDASRRNEMGRQAQSIVAQRFSMQRLAEDYKVFYHSFEDQARS
jgi:glycosyltransferase involved in cell wall biosynthesis